MAALRDTYPVQDWNAFVHRAVYAHSHASRVPVAARRRIEAYFLFAVEYKDGPAAAFNIALDMLFSYEAVTANHR